jgi:hypothetical protein
MLCPWTGDESACRRSARHIAALVSPNPSRACSSWTGLCLINSRVALKATLGGDPFRLGVRIASGAILFFQLIAARKLALGSHARILSTMSEEEKWRPRT